MSADLLISKLDKVRHTGAGRWVACCPAHNDKSPSLAVRELDDGRLLLHCFAGCTAGEVLNALGLDFASLFPDHDDLATTGKPERRAFPAADVLRCLALETTLVLIAAQSLADGKPVDRERLSVAAGRIQAGLDAAGCRNG